MRSQYHNQVSTSWQLHSLEPQPYFFLWSADQAAILAVIIEKKLRRKIQPFWSSNAPKPRSLVFDQTLWYGVEKAAHYRWLSLYSKAFSGEKKRKLACSLEHVSLVLVSFSLFHAQVYGIEWTGGWARSHTVCTETGATRNINSKRCLILTLLKASSNVVSEGTFEFERRKASATLTLQCTWTDMIASESCAPSRERPYDHPCLISVLVYRLVRAVGL